MNCPLCGSEIPSGVKYCPVCGADVEAAFQRAQQAQMGAMPRREAAAPAPESPLREAPTQQMPAQQTSAEPVNPLRQQQVAAAPQPQGARPLRDFDTSKMGGSPKWPIVVICILVLVIIAAVLLIFHPWDLGGSDDSADMPATVVQTDGADDSADAPAAEGDQAADVSDAGQDAASVDVFGELTNYYNQLSGYNDQISSVASSFNANYMNADQAYRQSEATTASNLASQLSGQLTAVQSLAVAEGSVYYTQWQNIVTLYDCLWHRADVLSRAWAISANASDPASADVQNEISAILGADNDANGNNVYRLQYEELYPASQPYQA